MKIKEPETWTGLDWAMINSIQLLDFFRELAGDSLSAQYFTVVNATK